MDSKTRRTRHNANDFITEEEMADDAEVIQVVQVIGEITKSKDYKGSSVSHLAFGMIEEHCALGGFGTFSFPNEYGGATEVNVNRKES